ncbi:phosphatidylglycerol lysyltransferase domain-containing protein [bacterium 210820-DFI.6.52]|nr:phosphatidylglycerol lysyltransferase domain-containing protein [bacterium 210820-DFI.6.52]
MLSFKTPEIEDRKWVQPLLDQSQYTSDEYTFSNMFMWWEGYGIQFTEYEGMFLARSVEGETVNYMFPAGAVDVGVWYAACKADADAFGKQLTIGGAGPKQAALLTGHFGDRVRLEYNRDFYDYVYLQEKLATLSGKKYHSKRNHISYFEQNYNWRFEIIDEDNMADCLAMNEEWCRQNGCTQSESLQIEYCAVKKAFAHWDELGLFGGLIRVDDRVVAYSFGHALNDTMVDVHVEKAFSDYRGAYPIINREFARNLCGGYTYINREEDLGEEGLRKAKLSYHPECMVEKFIARVAD